MIVHRMSTQAPPPPVKFYKVIALSFLFLTVALLGIVIFITSKKATVTILTKQDKENVDFIATLNSTGMGTNLLVGTVTSTQFSWSETYQPTGSKKVEGVAKGMVILYNKTGSSQTLVKTTRLLTQSGVLFRLASAATIPANGQVNADVYADKAGSASEIPPSDFTIPGLSAEKQKVIFAKSNTSMKGGEQVIGVLSADDLANAKTDFEQKLKSAYESSLGASAAGVERIISVDSVVASSSEEIGKEVSEFKITGIGKIIIAEYNQNDLKKLIDKQIGDKVNPDTEKFVSLSSKPTVSIDSYDASQGSANLLVHQEIALTLDSNIKKLAPDNFVGMKKDEIERYVLGLDHVANVNVKFSPSWVFSAPTDPDKISVIVRSIK